MSREKRPWDCHQTLKAVKGAFYGGMGALAVNLLLLYIVGEQIWMPALTVVGIGAVVAGIVLSYVRLRCPRCGTSLMLGGRIPSRLPDFCPGCGKPL